jgi:DNA-binding NtrC family response regulator
MVALIVSPDAGNVAFLIPLLKMLNCEARAASTCREALDMLRQQEIGVVLSEADLPGGNWKDVLDCLASLAAPPRLIVTSRLADERLWAEVLNLGGYDVLETPFEREEVLRVVDLAYLDYRNRLAVRRRGAMAHAGAA